MNKEKKIKELEQRAEAGEPLVSILEDMEKEKKIKNNEEINWLDDCLYELSKIIEKSIEGDWDGIVHTEWLKEVRDIIKEARQEEREKVRKWIETKKGLDDKSERNFLLRQLEDLLDSK